MTACTNKARGAVVAALAGVLALGAVPAVALATGTADAQVDLLTGDEYVNGGLTLSGATVDGDGVWNTTATGINQDIKVTYVKLADGTTVAAGDDFNVTFYKSNEKGEKLGSVTAIKDPGYYVVEAVAKASSGYGDQKGNVLLHVAPEKLPVFTVYEVDPSNAHDHGDQAYTFTGKDLDIDVYSNGLKEGVDYTYKILKAETDNVDQAQSVAVHDAGAYVVYVIGQGKYAGADPEVYHINVVPFDFIGATVEVDDVIGSNTKPANPSRVYRNDASGNYTELDPTLVDLSLVSGPGTVSGSSLLFDKNGAYVFQPTYDKNNANLDETDSWGRDGILANVNVDKVSSEATYTYMGEALQDSYTIDLSKDESFDGSKVRVYGDVDENPLTDGSDYTVKVNGTTTTLNAGTFSTEGTYVVTIDINGKANGYVYGGTKTFTVKVVKDVLDADANVFVSFNKELVTSVEKTYDQSAIKLGGNLVVRAETEKGTDVTGDIDVKIYDENNADVTSIASTTGLIDAGTYTLEVTSSVYELTGTTEVPIVINKADLTSLNIAALEDWSGAKFLRMAGYTYVDENDHTQTFQSDGYTWDELGIEFMKDGAWTDLLDEYPTIENYRDTFLTLERYDAATGKWVAQDYPNRGKVAGQYRLTLKGNAADYFEKNFAFADEDTNSTTVEFLVVDPEQLVFTDVKPGDAFFNCIDWMFDAGYVKGYANTNVYGQYDSITRADVVTILYRMAKGTPYYDVDLGYSEIEGWQTGFGDVDGNMYYAKAIGWANKMGVVHGYDDGNFRPEQNVTREELATMLANFAKVAYGEDVKLDEAALETMPDAGSVSTFAEKAVSWCVANGLMGNGGSINPASDITRGETAAMGYNYMTKVVGKSNVN